MAMVLHQYLWSKSRCLLPVQMLRLSSSVNGLHRSNHFDLIISGAGIVGLALGGAIGQSPLLNNARVLILEGNTKSPPAIASSRPYSNRVCALSLGTVQFLKTIGVWSNIESIRAKPFRKIHVWDADSLSSISFSSDTKPEDIIGYIVENNVIHRTLYDKVESSDIEIRNGVTLKSINRNHTNVEELNPFLSLELDNGNTVTTNLLVGADGFKSSVRLLANFQKSVSWSYNQSAVVANIFIEQGMCNDTAWQRFLPEGPLALLPLSDGICSIVWSTTPNHAKELVHMSPELFVNALNTALFKEYPKSSFVSVMNEMFDKGISLLRPNTITVKQFPPMVSGVESNSREIFPLTFLHSPHYVKQRIALIGDAAHRVHPLAGLGVNLGISDAAILYKMLLENNTIGGDWGSLARLLPYEKDSQCCNVPVMSAINSLQKLYSSALTPVIALRSLGIQLTSATPFIKNFIIDQAER